MSMNSSDDSNEHHPSNFGNEAYDGVLPLYMRQMMDEPQMQKQQSTYGKLPVN